MVLTKISWLDKDVGEMQMETSFGMIKVVINSTKIVLDRITYAFRGRTGYFPEEVIAFQEKILQQIDAHFNANTSSEKPSDSIDPSSYTMTFIFSAEDVIMINECLNEICNGLKIDNFEDEVGISKDSAKNLLSEVNGSIHFWQLDSLLS
jgi:hypothetical protein